MPGKKKIPSTERIINLLVLLTESNVPVTYEQIMNDMGEQYPVGDEARRITFERDKKVLRDAGVPIVKQVLGGNDAGKTAYTVDKSEYALVDFGLNHDEMSALQQAAAIVRMGTPWGGRAVLWLGGEIVDDHEHTAARVVADDARLPALHEACARRRTTAFSYHGRARTVHPYGLMARRGFWYLICHDTERAAVTRYRVDRIEDEPTFSGPDSFDRPAGIVLEDLFARDAKLFDGGDDEHAIVRVEGRLAPGVVRELGEEAVRARLADGSVEVRVPCGNRFAFRNWLFAMVDRAEVIAPEEVRAEIVAELESIAGVGP